MGIYEEKSKVNQKIGKLTEQRKNLDKQIKEIKKKEDAKRKKSGQRLHDKIYSIYGSLLSKYDIEDLIHYKYFDDCDDSDKEMINKLTDSGYEGFYATELNYEAEGIIDTEIEDAMQFTKAMENHVKMLEEFKTEVLKLKKK